MIKQNAKRHFLLSKALEVGCLYPVFVFQNKELRGHSGMNANNRQRDFFKCTISGKQSKCSSNFAHRGGVHEC